MRDGTLVFPAQYKDADNLPHSTILWSSDHGENWHLGTGAKPNTTEAAVVELENGSLMLNMRDNRGGSRAVAISRDLGRTWNEHPSSRSALIEPVCMASLLRWSWSHDEEPGLLVFSNPNVDRAPRRRISLQLSSDDGLSWTHRLLLDGDSGRGYSCLTRIDSEHLGILYESSQADLVFERIEWKEVLGAPTER